MSTHKDPTSDPEGAATLDRETLGKMVRRVWIDWAKEQPTPKASWLVEWDGLSEPDKEVDRRIGEAIAAGRIHPLLGAREHELRELRAELAAFITHHEATDAIIADARGQRPEDGKALLFNYDQLRTERDELRAECERFREKLREILLAANREQQTEGVVQPFVAKWIRKRTAECERLRKDKERLDWMIANEARLSHSRDGDCCNVWIRSEEEGEDYVPAEGYPQKCHNDGRTAIDAAMQPSETRERAMTTDQILAQCDTIRELSEKATAAPWEREDIDLIVTSRTFAPSAAQALKVAIEGLEHIAEWGMDYSKVAAREALQQITEAFK